jgi:hypothetical protein
LRGIGGAVVGGIVGYFLFRWLISQGFYGIMIPGVLIGLGSAAAARGKNLTLGILCVVAAIGLTIWAEWSVAPFVKDKSLSFFVTHLHQLPAIKLIMMALGAAAAFWFGQGR